MEIYKETKQQIKEALKLGLIEELNAHFLNCENWNNLDSKEKSEAYIFAVILFECPNKENIWFYGVYC